MRRSLLAPATAVALAVLAGPAVAQTQRDTFSFSFSSVKPKSSTGYAIGAVFKRERVIDQITISFPTGTRFDTAAVARCSATDAEVEAAENGLADVCPAASKVGAGQGRAILGDNPEPVVFDLVLYNRAGGAYLDILLGGKTAFYSVPTISGRKMIVPLTQAPGLNSRITRFELLVDKAGTKAKPYVRMPATCPRSKRLSAAVTARESGAGSQTTKDSTPCKR